jgi:hypothetical protein
MRVSRNLTHTGLEAVHTVKLVEIASARIHQDTVLALDLRCIARSGACGPVKFLGQGTLLG